MQNKLVFEQSLFFFRSMLDVSQTLFFSSLLCTLLLHCIYVSGYSRGQEPLLVAQPDKIEKEVEYKRVNKNYQLDVTTRGSSKTSQTHY